MLELLNQGAVDVSLTLDIASRLAKALSDLHADGRIHQCVWPSNITVTVNGDNVAATLSAPSAAVREVGEADWPYLSPEQTGWANQPVDCRADFYSLGAVMYRMLTGELPFQASDPLEWAHCHIARLPRPPAAVIPGLPVVVSDLVMKLMAKTADDRYQTAEGLQHDLQRCLVEWRQRGDVAPFPLGTRDIPERLRVPPALYGREAQTAALADAFERMATTGEPQVALIAGPAGIGKSTLAQVLHAPVAAKRGYFVTGKFDQYHEAVPYAALREAFGRLVQQLSSESEARLHAWREALLTALRGNGQALLELMPRLASVLGEQPALAELPPQEAGIRFQRAVKQFLHATASSEHPLVFFFDDLQWADSASLGLIEFLLSDAEARHMLFVVAYRDDEAMDDAHPLRRTLAAIEKATVPARMELPPLDAASLCRFVADALRCDPEAASPLAELVRRKTGGNPFFVMRFLQALQQDGLIVFDHRRYRWRWELSRVEETNVTDNLATLLVDQIRRLEPETQAVLQWAACLGSEFTLRVLASISDRAAIDIAAQLQSALRRGLLTALPDGCYRWIHDKIRQAARSTIAADDLPRRHLAIGRALLRNTAAAPLSEWLFDIASHLNAGAALIVDDSEKIHAAELNLAAAHRAKASIAYASALQYFDAGIRLLGDAWNDHYELTAALHFGHAEMQPLNGNVQAAIDEATALLARVRTRRDRVECYRLRQMVHFGSGEIDDAIEDEIAGLHVAGIELPRSPGWDEVIAEHDHIERLLGDRPIEAVADLPALTDPVMSNAVRLIPAGVDNEKNLFCLRVARMVAIAIEHGNSDAASCWYAFYGAYVLPRWFGEYERGRRYVNAALELAEKAGARDKARTVYSAAMLSYWLDPLDTCISKLDASNGLSIEIGDVIIAATSGLYKLFYMMARGDALDELVQPLAELLDNATKHRLSDVTARLISIRQFIKNLQGQTPEVSSFDDDTFQHEQFVAAIASHSQTGLSWYCVMRLRAAFLFGCYDQARHAGEEAEAALMKSGESPPECDFHIYHALTLAALFDDASSGQRQDWLGKLEAHRSQLRRWSELNPATFRHLHLLVSAEIARVSQQPQEAARHYEESILAARAGGFVQDMALAFELAARFYRSQNLVTIAEHYLEKAHAAYGKWGARGKVRQLESLHPPLRQAPRADSGIAQLDTLAIIKASQAISGEIVLDRLLDTLMRTVVEAAGAQSACLLFTGPGGLMPAVHARVEQEQVSVRMYKGCAADAGLAPMSILNYVRRSREKVLLADAAGAHPFSGDGYFIRECPRSVLCLPVLRQGEVSSVLYLEHRLIANAFTAEMFSALELIAAQAAISLENARLYAEVRQREARIRRLIDANLIGVAFATFSGEISAANDAFLKMIGYTQDDLAVERLHIDRITPPEYDGVTASAMAELRHRGTSKPYEKELLRKDGSRVPVLVAPVAFEGEREQGAAFVLDLSERKGAEAAREARRNAEAANAAKSMFLAHMSHELRTPLNTILGFGRLLARQDLSHAARQDLDVLLRSGEHLHRLIDEVLDLSKIEAGRATLTIRPANLIALLDDLRDMFKHNAQSRGVELFVEAAPSVPRSVRLDELKLRQILINLIGNALKFTRIGQVMLIVTANEGSSAAPESRPAYRLTFTVSDTGPGIAPEDVAQLGTAFVQTEAGRRGAEGTGLGLSISRGFVKLMGGEMRIESEPGRGTRVHVEIPVEAADPDEYAAPVCREAGRVVGLAPGTPVYRILVVDDHPEARELLTRLLAPLGFSVREAANGAEAISQWERFQPHLIWMDMRMPVMDGLAATRRIKASSRGSKENAPPVIVALTASSFEEERDEILAAGCDEFLRKPFAEPDVFALLERRLRLSFVYEDAAAPAGSVGIDADLLARLSPTRRTRLTQALMGLEADEVNQIVAEIGMHDAALATALAAFTDHFQYDRLLSIIERAEGNPAPGAPDAP